MLSVTGGGLYAQAPAPPVPSASSPAASPPASGPTQTQVGLGLAIVGMLTSLATPAFNYLDNLRRDKRARWEAVLAERKTAEKLAEAREEIKRVRQEAREQIRRIQTDVNSNATRIGAQKGETQAILATLREEGLVGPGSSDEIPLRPSILLVEDSPTAAQAMSRLLAKHGWQVEVAPTLTDGLQALNAGHDWVMLDLKLEDGDGIDILRKARHDDIPVRFVVTTGANDQERVDAVKAMLTEHDLYLTKPITSLDILFDRLNPRAPWPGQGGQPASNG
jgi:CheY-like chemotaxis protein